MENRVENLRKAFWMTQEELASASGVSRQTISDIEREAHIPRVDAAIKLARTLKTTVEELFPL